MKPPSLFVKLFASNLLLVVIIIALSFTISYVYLDEAYQARSAEHQLHLARMVRQSFQDDWPGRDGEAIDRRAKRLGEALPVRVTVLGGDGSVLGDSVLDPESVPDQSRKPEVEAVLKRGGDTGTSVRAAFAGAAERRFVALPIRVDAERVGLVRLDMPRHAVAESDAFVRDAVFWGALAAVVVAGALGLLLSWVWYMPMRQIAHAARKIASGNLNYRARIRGSDELAQLGQALNDMRASLASQIERVAAQRENLSAVVANLQEGIVALDARRHIVFMNDAALGLLVPGRDNPIGSNIQSVVRVAGVLDVLDELDEQVDSSVANRQIEVERASGRAVLDLHAVRVSGRGHEGIAALLVVRDITDLARTAAMKSEFVANASHELRTPVATILAAIDSLSSITQDDKEHYDKIMSILRRQAGRLEDMVKDLLDLHLVETSKQRLRMEDIRLGLLASWAEDRFEEMADRKGVELRFDVPDPEFRFQCDRRLLQLILQNLVDNAIKFTSSGGMVDCWLAPADGYVLMTVRDTGCGIPKEMQPRVFERFFQADASRAGDTKVRGTGLGLAIVKHSAERLGAAVKLQSEPGKGTTVEIRLPTRSKVPA